MIIDKIYLKDYFANIIEEKWLSKDPPKNFFNLTEQAHIGKIKLNEPKQRIISQFDYEHIEDIIFDEKFKEDHYIIGQQSSYYFLSTKKTEDYYTWVSIIKNNTLSPLIKEIKFFKEMFPHTKTSKFSEILLLKNKLTDKLLHKNIEQKIIKKI